MKVDVHIRDTVTNQVAVHHDGHDWSGQSLVEFMYSRGNFSCDCNREAFFHRALGGEVPSWKCGTTRFVIDKIVPIGKSKILFSEKKSGVSHGRSKCSTQ